jgi:hypothetical protein
MNTLRRLPTVAICGGLWLLFLAGCEVAGTGGEAGEFTFHDRTRGPGEFVQTDQQLDRPLATGAFLDLGVRARGAIVRPLQASSSDPDVVTVEELLADGVLLRAGRAGQARLTVGDGQTQDSLLVSVSEVGQAIVHLYPVGELAADQASLDVSEAVLLPGARIWGFVEHRAPDGRALTGYGASPCQSDAGASVALDDDSDAFTLDAPGTAGAATAVQLTCGPTQVTLPLATADAATALEAYDYFGDRFGPQLEAEPGADRYVVVLARDAEGRLVQGSAGEPVHVTMADAVKPYVQVVEPPDSPELRRLLEGSRAVILRFSEPGTYALTVGWHGLEQALTFVVAPRT